MKTIQIYKCPVCGAELKPVSCCSKSTVKWQYCLTCKKKFETSTLVAENE